MPDRHWHFGWVHSMVRYLVIITTCWLVYMGRKTINIFQLGQRAVIAGSLVMHMLTLSALSAEYLLWTTVGGAGNQYKLGLSIIWGVYALLLVILGINRKQKHLRLAAIALFLVTLIKLFLYDLAGAGTITKTISFISLGVILLLVSYLYNKYKDVLFGSDEERQQGNEA
jgi:uncharacterized membrane protein